MPAQKRTDPYLGFRFRIDVDGIIEGGFSEVTGIQATTQVEDFQEGGVNDFVRKLPKETTYENIILKRGYAASDDLYRWHRNVIAGIIVRKTISIYMLRDHSEEIAHLWSFKEAFPIKWSGPDLKADNNNAVAFESIEFVHHGFI